MPAPHIKEFFKKILALLIVLFLLDFCLGGLLKYFYFKERYNSVTYVADKTREQALVFGSSKAMHQYVPQVFETKLNTTFYNCGKDDRKLFYHLAMLSAVLERYTPRYILLDIHPDEFSASEEGRLATLLPYKDNPAIKPFLKYNSKFESLKMLSKIYPYNSMLGDILKGSLAPKAQDPERSNKGYTEFVGVLAYHPVTHFQHKPIIKERVAVFESYLSELNKKHINITLVISPGYYTFDNDDEVAAILHDFEKKYPNVRFINYQNDRAFMHNVLFRDDEHMNPDGARAFSEDLANKLLNNKTASATTPNGI